MQKVRGRKRLGARIRRLLEFERDLERRWECESTADHRSNGSRGQKLRKLGRGRPEIERLAQRARQLLQGLGSAVRPIERRRQQGQQRHLCGNGLGCRNAQLGPRETGQHPFGGLSQRRAFVVDDGDCDRALFACRAHVGDHIFALARLGNTDHCRLIQARAAPVQRESGGRRE